MHLIDMFINPTFIVTMLAAICAFATVLTIAMPMLARDRMNHRMRIMAVERDKMRAERLAEMNARDRQGKLRQTPKGFMQQIVNRLNLRKMFDTEELRDRLKRAGLRGQAPLVAFMFFRVAAPPIFFVGAVFYLFVLGALVLSAADQVDDGAAAPRSSAPTLPSIFISEPHSEAPAVDQDGVPRRARHAAHLRAVGHVGRGCLRQGFQGGRRASRWSSPKS